MVCFRRHLDYSCCGNRLIKQNQKYKGKKVKIWTLATAPLTWVRLVTSSALQSRKWQLIGMSQWCRSALCGHPLPVLTDNWTHSAASRHTIAPISRTRPPPRSRSYYSFPIPLRVGGWVGLKKQTQKDHQHLLQHCWWKYRHTHYNDMVITLHLECLTNASHYSQYCTPCFIITNNYIHVTISLNQYIQTGHQQVHASLLKTYTV